LYIYGKPDLPMQKFKPLLIELIWLAVILNATVLITIFVFGWTFLSNHFDIRLHQTYFTISSWKIVLPLFIFFSFNIFIIKEIRHHFNRRTSNIITLVLGSVMILLIATINKQIIISEMIYFGDAGTYPPLSAMNEPAMKAAITPVMHVISNTLTFIQFIVTICLLYVAFKMGTHKVVAVNHNGVSDNGSRTAKQPSVKAAKISQGSEK